MRHFVERVRFVIHPNRGFVPVGDDVEMLVEREHIIHRDQIGLRVANHNLHFAAVAVVHFSDATCAGVDFVYGR